MKLHSLQIEGFKRIQSTKIFFGEATFLIGPNNAGKSTVLKAIEWLLSAKKAIPSSEYFSIVDKETGETKPAVDTITLEAEFRNLPVGAKEWRGFKGRIFSYPTDDAADSGLSVRYKKTYKFGEDVIIEFRSKERDMKPEFVACKTWQELIDNGAPQAEVQELSADLAAKIGTSKAAKDKLDQLDAIWDTKDAETWFQNPGGIPGVVLKMLPRLLLIPADTSAGEIEGTSSGVLGMCEAHRKTTPKRRCIWISSLKNSIRRIVAPNLEK
jgi:putative ATP-dependent endonuclease of the OLD family